MDESVDLYQQLAKIVDEHEYIFGHDTNCPCGAPGIWFWSDYRDHMAQLIGDLLIDLAGTGQLLASIDRIAKPPRGTMQGDMGPQHPDYDDRGMDKGADLYRIARKTKP